MRRVGLFLTSEAWKHELFILFSPLILDIDGLEA